MRQPQQPEMEGDARQLSSPCSEAMGCMSQPNATLIALLWPPQLSFNRDYF